MHRLPSSGALGLALAACAQLTLLSSPAFADGTPPSAQPAPAESSSPPPARSSKTGWIVLGIGGALTVGGIVLDIVGTQEGSVSGAGGLGDSGKTSNARTNFFWGGTGLIVAGVVTGIVGGSMIMSTSDQHTPPPAEEGSTDGASKAVQAAYASAPSFTVPVLGATF
ncbi:MAG TPA: hypothetical protein VGG39_20835 [Polyangiaceae bacterium]|jgi:hypothetical protein